MSEAVSLWGVPEISQYGEMVRKLQEEDCSKHIWGRSCLGGGFKHFLCSRSFGDMIQFD